jgi:hypothetical protein
VHRHPAELQEEGLELDKQLGAPADVGQSELRQVSQPDRIGLNLHPLQLVLELLEEAEVLDVIEEARFPLRQIDGEPVSDPLVSRDRAILISQPFHVASSSICAARRNGALIRELNFVASRWRWQWFEENGSDRDSSQN